MSIDPRYIADDSLQQFLVDKDSGLPLAGGQIYFYADNDRTQAKNVYQITGNAPDYSFSALSNPIYLSGVGTVVDGNNNQINLYYLPYDDQGDLQLYFIQIYNSNGVLQYTLPAYPPSAASNQSGATSGSNINLIPNGQFLAHNNIQNDGLITQASTIIAPGGWTFELTPGFTSENYVTFTPNVQWTNNPPGSPPFNVRISCLKAIPGELIKSIRVKWSDVNSLASDIQEYTFGFWAQSLASTLTVNVNIVKYFGAGGSAFVPVTVQTFDILPNPGYFSATLPFFDDNDGYTYGTPPTYIAIDISFPRSIAFDVELSSFVLQFGDTPISEENYPIQSDADSLTRSVAGWMTTPDYNGMSLYLPLVNTAFGTTWDDSSIGDIDMSATTIQPNPSSSDATTNRINCDGSYYLVSDFSYLGIPYKRLFNKLFNYGNSLNVPLYGTGSNYLTCYPTSIGNTLMVATNSPSATVSVIQDGSLSPTGFVLATDTQGGVFGKMCYIGYTSPTLTQNAVISFANDGFGAPAPTGSSFTPATGSAMTESSPFDANNILWNIENYSEIAYLTPTGVAPTLQGGASQFGPYITFESNTPGTNTDWFLWMSIDGVGNEPTAPAGTGIKLNVLSTYNYGSGASDYAQAIQLALSGFQISRIETNDATSITPGAYFEISTETQHFNVYYVIGTMGEPPATTAIPIPVYLVGNELAPAVATLTQQAINSYQFAVPNFQGMFPRGVGPVNSVNPEANMRIGIAQSSVIFGNQLGTFEIDSLRLHEHNYTSLQNNTIEAGSGANAYNQGSLPVNSSITLTTGGYETRPVDFYINYTIRY